MYLKKIAGLSGLRVIYAVFGLAYSIIQVRLFGTSRLVEIFFVANTVASLVTSLTQSGQLSEFFLPIYLSLRVNQGKDVAHRAFSVLINRFVVFLSVILIIFYFISPLIVSLMAPGFSVADRELCVKMFRIFLILLELQFINSFIDVTLNAEKIFGRVEWAAILNSVISLILLILFYKVLGIWILVLTLFVGKLLEFVITIIFVRKVGIKYSLIWSESFFDAKTFFKLMFTTSGYVLATQFYNMVFTAMATLLPQGTYAIYKYVQQISSKASGILLSPLSTVFFSHFSENVVSGEKLLERKMRSSIFYSFIIGLVLVCMVILFGKELIDILWKTKKMNDYFLHIGYWMLIFNFIAFILMATGSIYRKTVISLNNGKYLYHIWILTQIISAALAYIFLKYLGWFGLALEVVANAFLMSQACVFVARKSGIVINKTVDFNNMISIIVSALIFIASSFLINYILEPFDSIIIIISIKLIIAALISWLLVFFLHKKYYDNLVYLLKSIVLKLIPR